MGNVGSGIADVAVHLAHDPDMLVAVQQRVLFISTRHAWSGWRAMRGLVSFETSIREHDDQALGALIGRWNWDMLVCSESWQ